MKKNLSIFEKYRDNLNFLISHSQIDSKYGKYKDNYICPICLSKFDTVEGEIPLTLEDAPQKSIGGSTNTLTCKKCNNEAGFKIDHHLVNQLNDLDNRKFLPNTEIKVKTDIDGENLSATLKIDENGEMTIFHSKKNNNPAVLDVAMPKLTKDKVVDIRFVRKNVIPDNLDYAVLKSAYILLFQHTGYKVILSSDYDIIRSQILKPETRILPHNFYLLSEMPFMNDGVHFVCEKGLEIIAVIFTAKTDKSERNFCVFLPLPGQNYERTLKKIFKIKQTQGELKLSAFPEFIENVDYITDLERITRLDNWIKSL